MEDRSRDRYGGLSSRELWFWLSTLDVIGPVSLNRLLGVFGSPEGIWTHHAWGGADAWNGDHDMPCVELKPKQIKELGDSKLEPEKIAKKLAAIEKDGIAFIGRNEADFPDKLRSLPDCPAGLFVKGSLPMPDMPMVAIVGARSCDEYGRQMAEYLGRELASHGIGVVSGMAAGIDGESQWAALRSGGYSLAVLGSGVDICYPRSNYNLYEQLIRDGGVVSENVPGTIPQAFRFPMRNRLVSAFSDAVLVVEARERSGSLITADHALEQGRDVMAVPGRVGDQLSEGCNRLIRQGAVMVTCFEDVCEVLCMDFSEQKNLREAEDEERKDHDAEWMKIIEALSSTPSHIDNISEKTGIAISELMHDLLLMEMRGMVRQVCQGQYVKLLFPDR